MECLIGIKGRDFVLMATDCVAGRSIIAMKKGVVDCLYCILFCLSCWLHCKVQRLQEPILLAYGRPERGVADRAASTDVRCRFALRNDIT